jgi:SAM-dependent methyltransferase
MSMLIYDIARSAGACHKAHQFSSRVMCAQERLVYGKALEVLRPSDRVLDWGCGNGHFSFFLAWHEFKVDSYALDERPKLLSYAPVAFTRGADVTALPYESGTFDAVFGVGVLEHVYERGGSEAASLAELERVLKPGGLLLIFHLPNRTSWLEWIRGKLGKPVHERRYSRAEALALFRERCFGVVEEGRYHILPRASFNRLPRVVRDSRAWCAALDAVDDALAWMMPALCQNWYFVLRKSF